MARLKSAQKIHVFISKTQANGWHMGQLGRGLGGFGCSSEGAHFPKEILYKICKSAPAAGEMVNMRIQIRPVESKSVMSKTAEPPRKGSVSSDSSPDRFPMDKKKCNELRECLKFSYSGGKHIY